MTQNNDNNSDEQLSPEIEERKAEAIILLKNWAKNTPNIGEKRVKCRIIPPYSW